ncbi:hypothetical protein [Bosea sp. 2YAB26]|jgi:hypothetical protein
MAIRGLIAHFWVDPAGIVQVIPERSVWDTGAALALLALAQGRFLDFNLI